MTVYCLFAHLIPTEHIPKMASADLEKDPFYLR